MEAEWRTVIEKTKLVFWASRVSRECIKRWKKKLTFINEEEEDEIRGRKRWQIGERGGDIRQEAVAVGGVMGEAPLRATMKGATEVISALISPDFPLSLVNSRLLGVIPEGSKANLKIKFSTGGSCLPHPPLDLHFPFASVLQSVVLGFERKRKVMEGMSQEMSVERWVRTSSRRIDHEFMR